MLAIESQLLLSAIVLGVFKGSIYAVMALGIVASFRINRVVNLGIAGLAVFGATMYFQMSSVWGAPILVALAWGLLVGAVLGAGLGLVMLWTTQWPRGFVMILTLTMSLFLFGWSDRILPPILVSPTSPFGDRGGFYIAMAFVRTHHVGTLVTALVVALLCGWIVTRTRAGVYVRAIYDDPDSAATLGVPIGYFVVGVYTVVGVLGALAGILAAPIVTLDPLLLLFVTVWALAGSILGGLESFTVAFAGSILVGLAQSILGSGVFGNLGPGVENVAAIAIVAAAVLWAGIQRRELAHIQT